MARDKEKDDLLFNCSQKHEVDYVAGLYNDSDGVRKLLKEKCASNIIYHSTHKKVYELINKELGYVIPE